MKTFSLTVTAVAILTMAGCTTTDAPPGGGTGTASPLSARVVNANTAYVECLVDAFAEQAERTGQPTKASVSSACTAQERRYYDAVYNEKEDLQANFRRNNATAAVRRLKNKVFHEFEI